MQYLLEYADTQAVLSQLQLCWDELCLFIIPFLLPVSCSHACSLTVTD